MIPRSPTQTPIKSRPKHRSKSLIQSPTFSKSVNPLPPKMDKPDKPIPVSDDTVFSKYGPFREEQLPKQIKPIPEPIKFKKDNKNILNSTNIFTSKKMKNPYEELA